MARKAADKSTEKANPEEASNAAAPEKEINNSGNAGAEGGENPDSKDAVFGGYDQTGSGDKPTVVKKTEEEINWEKRRAFEESQRGIYKQRMEAEKAQYLPSDETQPA